jgi:hypothetical protein
MPRTRICHEVPRSSLVRNLLVAVTLIGAAGTAGVYFSVARERFWVNWLVWTLFLLTLGLGNLFLVALNAWWARTGACPCGACPSESRR